MSEDKEQTRSNAPRASRARRRRWVAVVLVTVVFAAGFVTGAGTAVLVILNRAAHVIHHPEEAARRISRHLAWRLDLDEKQAEQVAAIVAEQQQAILAIRREVQPRFVAELERTHTRIAGVLDEAQREQWQRMFQTLRTEWLPDPPAPSSAPGATRQAGPEAGAG